MKKYISDDQWLVQMLVAVAVGATLFFYVTPGPLAENLGLQNISVLLAQVSGTSVSGDDDNSHETGTIKHGEHSDLFDMVPHSAATHVATGGDWFDTRAWREGELPTANARVVIPEGVKVTYAGQSDTRIFWIRVDGELHFDPNADSKLVVDTLIVDADGTLEIGTENDPVTGSVDIVIADNGDIDVNWDKLLQSRGVISHGTAVIHGEEKMVHGKVETDPRAGDTSITMAETPLGWEVGDTIVIAGTNYYGPDWYNRDWRDPEDELRTITAVNGRTVTFAQPLVNDHKSPRSDLKTSVANYTRTVTVRSENGVETPRHRRGHAMFMHNDDIDVRYAAFNQLGRTDKSVDSLEAIQFPSLTPTSNVRGRYSLHIHRSGATDYAEDPVIVLGNAVLNSPGWGYVHHDSYAIFHNNASYDTFGAGFVAETGNEIGTWTNNIAIYARGRGWKEPKMQVGPKFDMAVSGDGFWFQGRLVKARNNVAASVDHGYAFFHRGGEANADQPGAMIKIPYRLADFPDSVFNGSGSLLSAAAFPITNFNDNEVFAARAGLQVTKANPVQGHDVHTTIRRLTAWNVIRGAELTYTSHYHLEDLDFVGREPVTGKEGGAQGLTMGTNAADMTMIAPRISNFKYGMWLSKSFSFTKHGRTPEETASFVVVNQDFSDLSEGDYQELDLEYDTILKDVSLPLQSFKLVLDEKYLVYHANNSTLSSQGVPSKVVSLKGIKYDGIGEIPIPAGADNVDSREYNELKNRLRDDGYWKVGDELYFILPELFTDRATGEVHKVGIPIKLDPATADKILQYVHYAGGSLNSGTLDFSSTHPEARGERIVARPNRMTTISGILDNDSDPDGDALSFGGFAQPEHGIAYLSGDDTIVYRPDFDYEGTDKIKYWVVDSNGKYAPAYIAINVTTGSTRPESIEAEIPQLIITNDVANPDLTPPPTPTPSPDPEETPNTAPVAQNDFFITNAETVVTGNVLTNDFDANGDTLSVTNQMRDKTGSDGGVFTIDTNGDFTFEPANDFGDLLTTESKPTTVQYTISDGTDIATGIVRVTVSGLIEPELEPNPEPPTPPRITQKEVLNKMKSGKLMRFNLKKKGKDSCSVERFESVTESDLINDTNYQYELGLFDIEVDCLETGGTVTMRVELDQEYDTSDWVYRKYDTSSQEYTTINNVTYLTEDGVTVVEYDVTDGGPLDQDGQVNGVIVDPAGPATIDEAEVEENNTGAQRSSGGSSSNSSSRSNRSSTVSLQTIDKNISFNQPQYNDPIQVRYLEQFLNDFENENLTVDGVYDGQDNEAVKRFQQKYKREILDVWNLSDATGYVGITTRLKINFLLKGQTAECPVFTEYNGGLSGIKTSSEIGQTQEILRDLDMYNGSINNVWDKATNQALITFQETFREVMLDPWNITKGTGYKYKTTNKFLNYFAGCDTGSVYLEGVGEYEGI